MAEISAYVKKYYNNIGIYSTSFKKFHNQCGVAMTRQKLEICRFLTK